MEEKEAIEEYPDSLVQIIVTEEESVDRSSHQDVTKSAEGKNKEQENTTSEEKADENTEGEIDNSEALDTLKVPALDIRRGSTLIELDKQHAWLSELEEKCMNLETAFISKIQYVAVSNHCQKYLDELSSDESMAKFRTEFSSLFDKFRTVFTGSQRLLNKLQETKGYKNVANTENRKLKSMLDNKIQKNNELEQILENLQKNLMEMEKEKLTIQRMFDEYRDDRVGDSLKEEQESEVKPGSRDIEEAQVKINELEEQLELLSKEFEFAKNRESLYQKKIQDAENLKTSLQTELNSVKCELQRQITRVEKAETIVLEKSADITSKTVIIKSMTEEAKQLKADLARCNEEAKRLLKEGRKCQKDLDGSTQVTEKLRKDLRVREDRTKMLTNQKDSIEIDLTNKQAEVYALKGDIVNITKERNSLSRKAGILEERNADAETKIDNSRKENAAQQKELYLITKELDLSNEKVHELTKQKDAVTDELRKCEKLMTNLEGDVKLEGERCHAMERELDKLKLFAGGLQDTIKRLERNKEQLTKEIVELNKTTSGLRGEITRLELDFSEVIKTEEKVRQQLADEQVKFKNLAQDERHSRRLLAESRHKIEQLRAQQVLLKKHMEQLQVFNQNLDEQCKKSNATVKSLTEQIGNMKELHKQEEKNIEELNAKLTHKDDQEQLLLKNLGDMRKLSSTLKNQIKNLLEEKNVQNSKLSEKEREISNLKENIRLLSQEVTTLDKSLNDRINDIKLLNIQIAQMSRSNVLMKEQVENMDVTRQELTDTHTKLLEEKTKSKALEGEIQKPINLHRWRILEGIDPDRVQLLARNQTLQKQLIRKSKELDNKEIELRENIKLNQELQEKLRRRSEADDPEQLWACRKELNARTERVRILTTENTMYESVNGKYRHEITALKDELRKYKMKEFNSRTTKKRKVY